MVFKHVLVPNRDNETINVINTAMDMVRKIEKCRISRKQILEYWKDNGFGD